MFWIQDLFKFQGYGSKDGVFCGVFDGHGKDGEIVSKIVRNRLPSLILKQKNAISKYYYEDGGVNDDFDSNKQALKWKEAYISAFKVMDKEIKLVEKLDCSSSGTTAVVVIKQAILNNHSIIYNTFVFLCEFWT